MHLRPLTLLLVLRTPTVQLYSQPLMHLLRILPQGIPNRLSLSHLSLSPDYETSNSLIGGVHSLLESAGGSCRDIKRAESAESASCSEPKGVSGVLEPCSRARAPSQQNQVKDTPKMRFSRAGGSHSAACFFRVTLITSLAQALHWLSLCAHSVVLSLSCRSPASQSHQKPLLVITRPARLLSIGRISHLPDFHRLSQLTIRHHTEQRGMSFGSSFGSSAGALLQCGRQHGSIIARARTPFSR